MIFFNVCCVDRKCKIDAMVGYHLTLEYKTLCENVLKKKSIKILRWLTHLCSEKKNNPKMVVWLEMSMVMGRGCTMYKSMRTSFNTLLASCHFLLHREHSWFCIATLPHIENYTPPFYCRTANILLPFTAELQIYSSLLLQNCKYTPPFYCRTVNILLPFTAELQIYWLLPCNTTL